MRFKFLSLKQGFHSDNRGFFFNSFDPSGSYTGNYLNYSDESCEPEQDADDL